MIKSEKVFLKRMGNKNLKYYSDLGYNIDNKEFLVDIKDLTSNSKVKVNVECDFCGKVVEIQWNLYLKNISSHNLFACSHKCGKYKTIKTNLDRYGVEYAVQSQLVKDKTIQTNLERWGGSPTKSEEVKIKSRKTNLEKRGVEYSMQSKEIQEKGKKTNLDRYGVEFTMQSKDIQEKSKRTLLLNWGVENPSHSIDIQNKKVKTSLENWGVENPSQSKEIKEKKKSTSLINLGVEYPMQSKEVREKSKKTLLLNWGVDHNTKSPLVLEKIKKSNLEIWGVEWTLQIPEVREKSKITNLQNWGTEYVNQSEEFRKDNFKLSQDPNYIKYLRNLTSLFKCERGHDFEITSDNYFSRKRSNLPLCTVCYPIGDSRSIKEEELFKFIKSIYNGEIIQSYRDDLEIDIYLPDLKIGFEFNGLYWHSEKYKEKNYHQKKKNHFKERDIRIIYLWEDDWDNKKDIIKSQIKNWLGLVEQRIYARKCKVVELKSVKNFLNQNHIQGVDHSSMKLGLTYNDQLVSVMTFNKLEGRDKMGYGEWNLSRFCNLLNTSIIGGASKLLNYFIEKYSPKRIISYADMDWSVGGLYEVLGFNNISESKPDYKYLVDNRRVHKSNYKKSKLKINEDITESDFMKDSGYYKIWDCGKIKFEKKL